MTDEPTKQYADSPALNIIMGLLTILVGIAFVAILVSMAAFVSLHAMKEWRIYRGDSPCLVYK